MAIRLRVQGDQIERIRVNDFVNVVQSGDYEDLTNKPQINGVTLEGNLSTDDIGIDVGVTSFNGETGDITYTADVLSVNGQTGEVVLSASDVGALPDDTSIPTKVSELENDEGFISGIDSTDVTTALGYTPYNATNPDGFITGIDSTAVTTALGYTPYNSTNPNGYITGIDSTAVTTALGYTPYSAENPNGYITGIDDSDVTTALGYTPYNATNPDEFVNATEAAQAAPVQSVNGQTGTVTLSIPTVPTNVSDFNNDAGYLTSSTGVSSVNGSTGAVTGIQTTSNLVTSVDSNSTDTQYPSAKCLYDLCGDIETLLAAI